MSRNARGSSQSKSGGSGGKGGSLFAGILVGMLLGLIVAAGVAWYILKKNPASFEAKERHEVLKLAEENKAATPPISKVAPVASASATAATGSEDKQHFEFYKVLADGASAKNQVATKEPKVAAAADIYYVQAGSFPNQDDAEKLKAKLALLGLEATLQMAIIPNKGTYHRVRLGPFKSADEMNKILASLKQNGVANATAIKAQ